MRLDPAAVHRRPRGAEPSAARSLSDTPTVFHVRNRLCELILWLLVCLAPWAFGSVEAWAELGLYALIGLLTILVPGACDGSRFPRFLARLPVVALIGDVSPAFRALPLSRVTLSWIAPTSAAPSGRSPATGGWNSWRSAEPGPAVPLAAATPVLTLTPASRPRHGLPGRGCFHCVLRSKTIPAPRSLCQGRRVQLRLARTLLDPGTHVERTDLLVPARHRQPRPSRWAGPF